MADLEANAIAAQLADLGLARRTEIVTADDPAFQRPRVAPARNRPAPRIRISPGAAIALSAWQNGVRDGPASTMNVESGPIRAARNESVANSTLTASQRQNTFAGDSKRTSKSEKRDSSQPRKSNRGQKLAEARPKNIATKNKASKSLIKGKETVSKEASKSVEERRRILREPNPFNRPPLPLSPTQNLPHKTMGASRFATRREADPSIPRGGERSTPVALSTNESAISRNQATSTKILANNTHNAEISSGRTQAASSHGPAYATGNNAASAILTSADSLLNLQVAERPKAMDNTERSSSKPNVEMPPSSSLSRAGPSAATSIQSTRSTVPASRPGIPTSPTLARRILNPTTRKKVDKIPNVEERGTESSVDPTSRSRAIEASQTASVHKVPSQEESNSPNRNDLGLNYKTFLAALNKRFQTAELKKISNQLVDPAPNEGALEPSRAVESTLSEALRSVIISSPAEEKLQDAPATPTPIRKEDKSNGSIEHASATTENKQEMHSNKSSLIDVTVQTATVSTPKSNTSRAIEEDLSGISFSRPNAIQTQTTMKPKTDVPTPTNTEGRRRSHIDNAEHPPTQPSFASPLRNVNLNITTQTPEYSRQASSPASKFSNTSIANASPLQNHTQRLARTGNIMLESSFAPGARARERDNYAGVRAEEAEKRLQDAAKKHGFRMSLDRKGNDNGSK